MRMFRLPSWISESKSADKVVHDTTGDMLAGPEVQSMILDMSCGGLLKRKRGEDDEMDVTVARVHKMPMEKRRKCDVVESSNVPGVAGARADASADLTRCSVEAAMDDEATSRIREAVESQFSLEILLKHDELRLIDQELAKCQVALEQLRRCHLIPYPSTQQNPLAMAAVSSGTGPALEPKSGMTRPEWAAPYGVTDGPYSRHYAKWLIPDPSFDPMPFGWEAAHHSGKMVPEGRTTRNSFAEGGNPSSKARTQRGSASQKLQALSSGYAQPKEKAGPCVLKRGDGKYVKLVCIDCNRDNFSSTQGFINHCRIAHRRDFKSHEEAAVASGHPVEVDDLGGIVGEERTPAVASNLVHPLIRSAPTTREAEIALLSRIDASMDLYRLGMLPGVTSIPGSTSSRPLTRKSPDSASKNFVPSTTTPHLSALMRRRGFDGNLDSIVIDAQKKDDLTEDVDVSHSDSEAERPRDARVSLGGTSDNLPRPTTPISAMRVPTRSGMSPAPLARPSSSSKGLDTKRSPRPAFATPLDTASAAAHVQHGYQLVTSPHEPLPDSDEPSASTPMSIIDLSPHTVASNNAPSLVSDSDDDDIDSEMGMDIDHARDDDDDDDDDVRKIRIEDAGEGGSMALLSGRKEERHVTFLSPGKGDGKGKGRKK